MGSSCKCCVRASWRSKLLGSCRISRRRKTVKAKFFSSNNKDQKYKAEIEKYKDFENECGPLLISREEQKRMK